MSLFETREVTAAYSNAFEKLVTKTTTFVKLPSPEHMVCLELGDETLSFTTRELFDALGRLLGKEVDG